MKARKTLLGLVVLQNIQQKGSGLLQQIPGHKDLNQSLNAHQRSVGTRNQVLGKLNSLSGLNIQQRLHQSDPIGGKASFVAILEDLLVLASFGEEDNHLVGDVAAVVDLGGKEVRFNQKPKRE